MQTHYNYNEHTHKLINNALGLLLGIRMSYLQVLEIVWFTIVMSAIPPPDLSENVWDTGRKCAVYDGAATEAEEQCWQAEATIIRCAFGICEEAGDLAPCLVEPESPVLQMEAPEGRVASLVLARQELEYFRECQHLLS